MLLFFCLLLRWSVGNEKTRLMNCFRLHWFCNLSSDFLDYGWSFLFLMRYKISELLSDIIMSYGLFFFLMRWSVPNEKRQIIDELFLTSLVPSSVI